MIVYGMRKFPNFAFQGLKTHIFPLECDGQFFFFWGLSGDRLITTLTRLGSVTPQVVKHLGAAQRLGRTGAHHGARLRVALRVVLLERRRGRADVVGRVRKVIVRRAHLAYLMATAAFAHFLSVLWHVVNVDVAHFQRRRGVAAAQGTQRRRLHPPG